MLLLLLASSARVGQAGRFSARFSQLWQARLGEARPSATSSRPAAHHTAFRWLHEPCRSVWIYCSTPQYIDMQCDLQGTNYLYIIDTIQAVKGTCAGRRNWQLF